MRIPTPYERARIRVITRCDDSTIKNVFAELAGGTPSRKPSDASRERVLSGARELGLYPEAPFAA